jgi:flagellar basal body rod protein FlgB
MLERLFGEGTSASDLKAGLDRSTETVRSIGHRIANASTPQGGDFASVLDRVRTDGTTQQVDLEKEMVALAEEQIHFEVASRLLQKVYQQIRSSLRSG